MDRPTPSTEQTRQAIHRLVAFYADISPNSLPLLDQLYTQDAGFKDPFNEVQGVAAIRGIFEHMFRRLDAPRFVVTRQVVDADEAFLVWDFHFCFRGDRTPRIVRGGSFLRCTNDGRVCEHRDYWDAAEELYEKLPLLGAFMRWLKRRVTQA
jgi:ketosteroid isomerase-like protein